MLNKNQKHFPIAENFKPYVVIGLGFLVIVVSAYQLATGSAGSLLDPKRTATTVVTSNGSANTSKTERQIPNIDSDGDGLTDYEEDYIYHTNSLKPDSDSDGYDDGTEVRSGHDPLVPADKPVGDPTVAASTDTSSNSYYQYNRFIATTPDDLSSVTPSAISSALSSSSKTGSSDSSKLDGLSALALANTAISDTDVLPTIKDTDINISSASGKAAVQQYSTAVAAILLQYAPFGDFQGAANYLNAAMGGDVAKVQDMIRLANVGVQQLKALPVPKEAVELHKRAISLLQLFVSTATTLMNGDTVSTADGMAATNNIRILVNGGKSLRDDSGALLQKYGIKLGV